MKRPAASPKLERDEVRERERGKGKGKNRRKETTRK
jgi:hypothetical protein